MNDTEIQEEVKEQPILKEVDGMLHINPNGPDGEPDKVVLIIKNLPGDMFGISVWANADPAKMEKIWNIYTMARGIMHLVSTEQEMVHAAFQELSELTKGDINPSE